MIEQIVLTYLSQYLPAYMEVPEDNIDPPFVVIEKTRGGCENHISRATVIVQSYGKSLLEAAETNERVKTLMKNIIELDEISKVSLNSDYNFTDTAAKRYRYQAVFDIIHY